MYELILTFGLASAISVLIIASSSSLNLAGGSDQFKAVQTSHTRPTPRLGGFSVFASLFFYSLLLAPEHHSLSEGLVVACASLFIVGLLEDNRYDISPILRLSSAILASAIAMMVFDTWIARTDIPVLDEVLSYAVVGIPLTLVAVAGLTHAFNLVDGVNGLAGVVALAALFGLYLIADKADVRNVAGFCLIFGAGVLGFLIFNFPKGWIFLGDAGAYSVGFILAWLLIITLAQSELVSPWALLLTVFWPVADTFLAIWRRSTLRRSAMKPDRLHVHQLVMRSLEIFVLGRNRRDLANPITTVILAPFVMTPVAAGVVFWNKPLAALLSFVILLALFFSSYIFFVKFIRRIPHVREGSINGQISVSGPDG